MAQSLGTVTKRDDGGFEGTLSMMTLNTKITIKGFAGEDHARGVIGDGQRVMIGGAVGLALGLVASSLVASIAQWDVLIDASLVLIAVVASAGVGLTFGFFPARRAAQLSPIEALRYE